MDDARLPFERSDHRVAASADPQPRGARLLLRAGGRPGGCDPARLRPRLARSRAAA